MLFFLVHLGSGSRSSFWLPLPHISRRDVRISRGGQRIVRVTLLVSLRDDSIRRGKDSPCLMIVIVYIDCGLQSILAFIFPPSTCPGRRTSKLIFPVITQNDNLLE
jgi:hypothetical protein